MPSARPNNFQRKLVLRIVSAALFILPLMCPTPTLAEVKVLRIAHQHSMAFLVVDVMLAKHMIEMRAKSAGLDDIHVSAARFGSGPAANDALLKGEIEVGGAGLTPFLDLWSRTKGAENVRGVAPINDSPLFLITTDPRVKSVKDLGPSDKVAVPAPGSIQGLFLRMLANRSFDKPERFDEAMVSMTSPEGLKALAAPDGTVRNYVASIPFDMDAMELPGARKLDSSFDILDGPHTLVALFVTEKFKTENPRTYSALVAAIEDAMAFIKENPSETAEIFSALSKGTTSPKLVLEILRRPDVAYSPIPRGTMKFASFMHKIGALNSLPMNW
jgi:NitT/TauT family transport system substrate-binding protein